MCRIVVEIFSCFSSLYVPLEFFLEIKVWKEKLQRFFVNILVFRTNFKGTCRVVLKLRFYAIFVSICSIEILSQFRVKTFAPRSEPSPTHRAQNWSPVSLSRLYHLKHLQHVADFVFVVACTVLAPFVVAIH